MNVLNATTIYLKMVKMVKFQLHIFCHNLKEKKYPLKVLVMFMEGS